MMGIIDKYLQEAKTQAGSVVLPEGHDPRILKAARRMTDEGIARPIVLGTQEQLAAAAEQADMETTGLTTIDPAGDPRLEQFASEYRQGRDLSEGVARRMVKRPLYFAGMMVRLGEADTLVAGVATPTAMVIQAGVLTVGLAEGITTPSSFFLMVLPEFQGVKDKAMIFADCAVNIAPSAAELADIAQASAESAARLLPEEPRVAMLSFSTKGSASHEHVDRVVEAVSVVRRRAGHLHIDGELQADAAIIPTVAAKKVKEPSAVVGNANVLIFPDLASGNIAYKLTQYMAGASAIGPFLQGFAKPLSDLSRGATADDILATVAVCLRQAKGDPAAQSKPGETKPPSASAG